MIVFYRILGNDIPVRHRPNQTLVNLSFILRNEAEFPRCEKRFLLNRIVDPQIRKKLQSIIGAAGLRCDEIPFLPDDYCGLGSAVEKALYLTNQNAARNRCIDLGLADADTVLPFDGQVFFSVNGWSDMVDALGTPDAEKYLAVPMFRLRENRHALAPWHPGLDDVDHLWAEPQIVVRRGHDIRFNERLSYGEANKVELLMRLGIPGPWDGWVGGAIPEYSRESCGNALAQFRPDLLRRFCPAPGIRQVEGRTQHILSCTRAQVGSGRIR